MPKEIYRYDDIDIIASARSQKGYIYDIIRRLDTRQLYKRVYSLKLDEVPSPEAIFQMDIEMVNKIEEEIAGELGANNDCILVDIPEYPSFHELSTPISLNGDIVKIGEVSNLVRTLKDSRFNHADLCIYMP